MQTETGLGPADRLANQTVSRERRVEAKSDGVKVRKKTKKKHQSSVNLDVGFTHRRTRHVFSLDLVDLTEFDLEKGTKRPLRSFFSRRVVGRS